METTFETLEALLGNVKLFMDSWDSVPPEMEDGAGMVITFPVKPEWADQIGPAIRKMGYDVFTTDSPLFGCAFYIEVMPARVLPSNAKAESSAPKVTKNE